MEEIFRSGFASLIGRPNVGKSTLLNYLVGRKIAIVSDKPQTTRNKIQGVFTTENYQAVLLDTPGIHKPKHRLGKFMVSVALQALKEVDVIFYLIDAGAEPGPGEQYILNVLEEVNTPVILIVNKIDTVHKDELILLIDYYTKKRRFDEVIPLSAYTGENVDKLIELLSSYLPEGPKYYPEGMISDQPEERLIAELIREKALLLTREEIPHSLFVQLEVFERRTDDLIYVEAIMYVERDSQKGIIIGKKGSMLKEIGRLAREELENLFGMRFYLDLRVKVRKNWRQNQLDLKHMGFNHNQSE